MKKIILIFALFLLVNPLAIAQKYNISKDAWIKDTTNGDILISEALYIQHSRIKISSADASDAIIDFKNGGALDAIIKKDGDNVITIMGGTNALTFYPDADFSGDIEAGKNLHVKGNLRTDSILATKSYTITLDADDKEADTKTSYLRIDSDDALSTERTFTLSDGVYDGQELFISFIAATNQAEIIDAGSEAGLNGNLTFDTQYESLTMKWDATLSIWMEKGRVDN